VEAGTRLEYKKTFLWVTYDSMQFPVADIVNGPHAGKRVSLQGILTFRWENFGAYARDPLWLEEPGNGD
jgi:hypothetical protein